MLARISRSLSGPSGVAARGVADCGKQQKILVMVIRRGVLLFVLCAGVAFTGLPLARAQQATSATLPEPPESVEATPLPTPEKPISKPTLEISAKPHQKPAPVPEHTPSAEELTTPAATTEKKTHAKRRETPSAQPEVAGSPVGGVMSLAAARAIAVKTRLPDYPYEAQRTNITGSGVCVMLVDIATGKVTSATMEQSTGNELLDKVTTDAFRKWRFKPRTVSEVRVPVTYE
jgi:TonB family protein